MRPPTRAPMARLVQEAAYELLDETLDERLRFDIESLAFALGEYLPGRADIPVDDAEQLLYGIKSLMKEAA